MVYPTRFCRNPEPGTRNAGPATAPWARGTRLLHSTHGSRNGKHPGTEWDLSVSILCVVRQTSPEIRNPKTETRKPTLETPNPKFDNRNPKPDTRHPKNGTRNPRNLVRPPTPDHRPAPQAREIRNPKFETQHTYRRPRDGALRKHTATRPMHPPPSHVCSRLRIS